MDAAGHLARRLQRPLLARRGGARLDLAAPPAPIGGMTDTPAREDRRTASMIRVDQAGEYGAPRNYAGTLAVLGAPHPMAREIAQMAEQEEGHRKFFDTLLPRPRRAPTRAPPE